MAHGEIEVHLHQFLTSAQDGGQWSTSDPSPFTPRKESMVPTAIVCVGPWTALGGVYRSVQEATAVAQWLRCCATNRKVTDSIPDGVTGILH